MKELANLLVIGAIFVKFHLLSDYGHYHKTICNHHSTGSIEVYKLRHSTD